jgi:hypothetical protein
LQGVGQGVGWGVVGGWLGVHWGFTPLNPLATPSQPSLKINKMNVRIRGWDMLSTGD